MGGQWSGGGGGELSSDTHKKPSAPCVMTRTEYIKYEGDILQIHADKHGAYVNKILC